MCFGKVSSSWSSSSTRRVNLVTNPVTSREWGKYREVFTTSGTYLWSFETQIFHNGQPSHVVSLQQYCSPSYHRWKLSLHAHDENTSMIAWKREMRGHVYVSTVLTVWYFFHFIVGPYIFVISFRWIHLYLKSKCERLLHIIHSLILFYM